MLRLVTIPKQVCLFCTIKIDSELFQKLNCATTGEKSGHIPILGDEKEKWVEVLREQLQNATVDDFNFKQLTNPEEWHRWVKSPRRSANAAFFTLLYRYNQLAKQKNKPTIDVEDIIQFIKESNIRDSDNIIEYCEEAISIIVVDDRTGPVATGSCCII